MNDRTIGTASMQVPTDDVPQSDETVTEAVVEAVAEAEGVCSLDLEPLARAIDPEALEDFVSSVEWWSSDPPAFVRFPYSGYVVTVTGGGSVSVSRPEPVD